MKAAESTLNLSLEDLYRINQIVLQAKEWKSALDQIARLIRQLFIFDNLGRISGRSGQQTP